MGERERGRRGHEKGESHGNRKLFSFTDIRNERNREDVLLMNNEKRKINLFCGLIRLFPSISIARND